MILRKISLLLFTAALSALLISCASVEDEMDRSPDFEVLKITMDSESKGKSGTFLDDSNFLMAWNILGPVALPEVDPFHTEPVREEKTLNGSRRAVRGAKWHVRRFSTEDEERAIPGTVDFSGKISGKRQNEKQIFYACATLDCESEMRNMTLNVGSVGKIKIWINGVLVYSYEKGRRVLKPDTDSVSGISLRRGMNRIVVKYMDNDGNYAKERMFSLRFTDETGRPTQIR